MSNNSNILTIGIFGTSGFAREVADICHILGYEQIIFIDRQVKTDKYFDYPLIDEKNIEQLTLSESHFVIGTGDNQLRKRIFCKFPTLEYVNLIHPTSSFGINQKSIMGDVKGNIITAGVRFTNNIVIGDFGIYNLNCTIGHDCIINDFVNISPGSNISGNVHIKEGVFIGTNASVIQGEFISKKLEIGCNSIIGAGAVVTRSIPSNSLAVGIPAKVKQTISTE